MRRILPILLTALIPSLSWACDICSIYSSIESESPKAGEIQLGIAEQYTYFGKLQEDNKYFENHDNQKLKSSITQIYGTYSLNNKLALQLTLPLIDRRFKRIEEENI